MKCASDTRLRVYRKLTNRELKECILALSYEKDDLIVKKGKDPEQYRIKFNEVYDVKNSPKIRFLKDVQFAGYDAYHFNDVDYTETVHRDVRSIASHLSEYKVNIIINPEMREQETYNLPGWAVFNNYTTIFICVYEIEGILRCCRILSTMETEDDGYMDSGLNYKDTVEENEIEITELIRILPSIVFLIFDTFGYQLLFNSISNE